MLCVVLSNSERNLIIIKGERLVKLDDLDCDAIRMLQQIVSEILNALNVSVQERKCNLQSTVFSKEKYVSKSGLLIKSLLKLITSCSKWNGPYNYEKI